MITKKEIIILKKILIELLIERKIGFVFEIRGLCDRLTIHEISSYLIPHFNFEEAKKFNTIGGGNVCEYWWDSRFHGRLFYDFNNRIDFLNYVINQNVSESKIKLNYFDVLKLDWYGLKYWFKVKYSKLMYKL